MCVCVCVVVVVVVVVITSLGWRCFSYVPGFVALVPFLRSSGTGGVSLRPWVGGSDYTSWS